MIDHDAVLKSYIKSDQSNDGEWWLNVPVGLRAENKGDVLAGATKEIDALCLVDRSPNLPDEYTYAEVGVELTSKGRIHTSRSYQRLWERSDFAGEHAVLVECKPNKPSFRGIGQLLGYGSLIETEWDLTVDQYLMVTTGRDPIVEHACSHLNIEVIRLR